MNEAIRLLTSAATPDPEFGDDLEAVRSTELRSRREAFVEMATAAFPPQPSTCSRPEFVRVCGPI